MTDDMLRKNLNWLMETRRLNATKLAKEMRGKGMVVSQPTLHRVIKGESKSPNEGLIKQLADFFNYPIAELRYSDISGKNVELSQGPKLHGMVPLISWVSAGHWTGIQDIDYEPETWFPSPKKNCDGMFALRVSGISMVPKFQAGDIVFVDPDAAQDDGKVVIAVMPSSGATMKQLVYADGKPYLKALNPDWPGDKFIKVEDDVYIVGVVIGKWVEC